MKPFWIGKVIPAAIAAVALALIISWWFRGGPASVLKERLPGADQSGTATGGSEAAKWEGTLARSNGTPADLPGDWPRFRGPHLDGISREEVPLARSWGPQGPPVLWSIDVGEGYAGAVVHKGRVYLMDYDPVNKADALRCLSLADGREIWRYTYPMKIKRYHGMSRTVPAVTDQFVVAMGPKCHVICLDPATGELRWKINLVKDYGTEVPEWYAGQCPLVDGGRVILAPAGEFLVLAIDGLSGKVLWKTPNPRNWKMTHSSVVPLDFQGQRMYLYCASGGVVAVAAADGALLWETPDWKISFANVPSPVPLPDGRIFFSGGYNAGSLMLQLSATNQLLGVKPVFRLKQAVFGAVQHTPIFYRDHIFGVRPDEQLVCLDLAGKPVWESGPEHKFGKGGPFLIAQDLIYLLNDDGQLTLSEASPAGFKQLATAKVLSGPDSWAPMALAGGRLIVRDLLKMICLNVARP